MSSTFIIRIVSIAFALLLIIVWCTMRFIRINSIVHIIRVIRIIRIIVIRIIRII